jgi:protoporphyrinogen IX oxidase
VLLSLLITLHVAANLMWIGSITTVGFILFWASKAPESEAKVIGTLARKVYSLVAQPAFGLAFLFGVAVLSTNVSSYMHLHWFHGKLTLVLAVIALHHIIGAKTRKVASGSMQQGGSGAILAGALLLCALLVVTLAVFRQNLIP